MDHKPLRALLVDDDPLVRELVALWLEDLGFAVTQTDSATRALPILDERVFDLVVADVNLGDKLDGFELAVAVADRQPDARVLFISAKAWGTPQTEEPDTTFLHKPFTEAELARSVRFVLADDKRIANPA
ncbi:MAG TPA: response regulator [Ramlibacter sp.]|uniref:response regulator n=1 Tax=Ramlibacter sp. TaxID=1917967 RepID=UPI002C9202E0|nr:response regulator [Ramlibacter sp.]HVZ43960.1 response regulator [Ramlibacter sp.]